MLAGAGVVARLVGCDVCGVMVDVVSSAVDDMVTSADAVVSMVLDRERGAGVVSLAVLTAVDVAADVDVACDVTCEWDVRVIGAACADDDRVVLCVNVGRNSCFCSIDIISSSSSVTSTASSTGCRRFLSCIERSSLSMYVGILRDAMYSPSERGGMEHDT